MAENLNYEIAAGAGSWCYGNNPENCEKYGRLYNWTTAMNGASGSNLNPSGVRGVCPSGWHLPSNAEWSALVSDVGSSAGKKLKSTTGWSSNSGTDEFGFSALPGGYRYTGGSFNIAGDDGGWWTATAGGSGGAYGRSMGYGSGGVGEDGYDVGNGLSVRCVGD
jgi:uncharacterized protein (TIGR02145 family)